MRVSPPEEARLCAAPHASSSRTLCPARWRVQAVQLPTTPAPITMASHAAEDETAVRAPAAAPVIAAPVAASPSRTWRRGPELPALPAFFPTVLAMHQQGRPRQE